LIQWAVREIPPTETGQFTFTLSRSGGPQGPWEGLTQSNHYAYVDRFNAKLTTLAELQPNQLQLFQSVFYKLTCVTPSGQTLEAPVIEAGADGPSRRMSQVLRKLRRNFRITTRYNGTPLALLKRRQWGVRCGTCVDGRTRELVRANCRVCWGTGIVDGYWDPILVRGRRGVSVNTTTVSPSQTSDTNDESFWVQEFPLLERDDVLVSLSDQERFRVDRQISTQIQLNTVHQELSCQELRRDHIVYQLRIREDQLAPLF
jgi:hypothetical protein